jgi:transcriptional regulator with XRE-family HTH domain
MNTPSETLGRRLKQERERRGILLETIAASTKISRSLLADLERDDVSKWPHGIFRRAFVREYAASIGLPPEPVVEEFGRIFPEEQPAPGKRRAEGEPARDLRLTFADGGRAPLTIVAARIVLAVLEASAILGVTRILAPFTGMNFWTFCGTASLTYYALAAACCGRTPVAWWMHRDRQRLAEGDERGRSTGRNLLGLLVQQAQMHRSEDAAAAENLEAASGIILPS